jgi:hypothetical protein
MSAAEEWLANLGEQVNRSTITMADLQALHRCANPRNLDDIAEGCFGEPDGIDCRGGDTCGCIGCTEERAVREHEARAGESNATAGRESSSSSVVARPVQFSEEERGVRRLLAPDRSRSQRLARAPAGARPRVRRTAPARCQDRRASAGEVRAAGYDPDEPDEPCRGYSESDEDEFYRRLVLSRGR